jgi:6-phosphogluconolactonase
MQLEVYQTDVEVYEAAAALAAERLTAAAAAGRATVALPGGRGGRALMLALAARGDVPWQRLDVFFTDECCLADGDARRTLHVARESLLGPRGVPVARVHAIPVDGGDPIHAAASYAEVLARELGVPPVLDLVLLDLGAGGEVAAVTAGSDAARSESAVAPVDVAHVAAEPRVARVTLTVAALRAARCVIVTATGAGRAAAVEAALREPVDPLRRPAQAVLPSATVSWFVDRAAAAPLLREAHPAPGS